MTPMVALERTLTQAEFDRFARLSGDDNPIHVDPAYAAGTRFGRTVAHGLFLCTILRGLAGRLAPGGLRHQDIRFPAPTYAGEPMRFSARLLGREDGIGRIAVSATRIADGIVTCDGTMDLELHP